MPTQRDLLPYLPRRALKEQVTGTAILICHITLKRRARQCSVESETPKGYGFGESALALAHVFLIWPVIIDGAPFDGAPVRIPVIFEKPAA